MNCEHQDTYYVDQGLKCRDCPFVIKPGTDLYNIRRKRGVSPSSKDR